MGHNFRETIFNNIIKIFYFFIFNVWLPPILKLVLILGVFIGFLWFESTLGLHYCADCGGAHRFSSSLLLSEEPARVPDRYSYPGSTLRQAIALTIKLRHTP
jgi:hypothetical protein